MRTRRRLRKLMWWSLGFFVLFVLLCNRWVINSTDSYIYTNFALLPENEVGIVLGTSAYTRDGEANPQFHARVQAAIQLYEIGKVRHLIVSGANPDRSYNEPRKMWQELTRAGIPASDITMDFAGFRTLDTMARASQVFNLKRCTIITQRYHSYRAAFLGKKMGIRVSAFVAPINLRGDYGSRNPTREIFARVKAVLDLFVLRTQPRFLGDPEPIQMPDKGGRAHPDAPAPPPRISRPDEESA